MEKPFNLRKWYLHCTFKIISSSTILLGSAGLTDLQDRCFPSSVGLGVKCNVVSVSFDPSKRPSGVPIPIFCPSNHHVVNALGREPFVSQRISWSSPAINMGLGRMIFASRGSTKRIKNDYNEKRG